MPNYKLINKTPMNYRCGVGACPAIYEAEDITPKSLRCGIGGCPSIYASLNEKYLIIGKIVDAEQVKALGLEKKIGENEALIEVPKGIIDDKLE